MIPAPHSTTELLHRAEALAGCTLVELAQRLNVQQPANLSIEKGWAGQLLELALGATAHSKAEPDFQQLGIELKTLPLTAEHRAKESTFVCSVTKNLGARFEESLVYQKLQQVLWVPFEADPTLPFTNRRIGTPILWSPTTEQLSTLAQDWSELSEMLTLGAYENISAKLGTYLQLRPKAAHSRVLRNHINLEGQLQKIIPRGFYLRTTLTNQIISA
jgi:DNA mismatch repair protein MutH